MKKVILLHVWAMSKRILQVFLIQCLSMSVLLAYNGNAQVKTIDQVKLKLNLQNTQLLDAFSRIEQATGFNFVYTNKE